MSCDITSSCHGVLRRCLTHVPRGATDGGGDAVQIAFGETEICQLDDWVLLVASQQHVFKLDVAIGHAHPVTVVQCEYQLLEDCPCLSFLRTTFLPCQHQRFKQMGTAEHLPFSVSQSATAMRRQ